MSITTVVVTVNQTLYSSHKNWRGTKNKNKQTNKQTKQKTNKQKQQQEQNKNKQQQQPTLTSDRQRDCGVSVNSTVIYTAFVASAVCARDPSEVQGHCKRITV